MADLGAVDGVERPALVEQQRLRCVEVLGPSVFALRPQDAAGHAGGAAGGVADGEDDPTSKTIVDAAPTTAPTHQPGALEVLLAYVAAACQRVDQGIPCVGRPAELEGTDGFVVEAPAMQVVASVLADLMAGQHLVVERDGRIECFAESLALGILAAGALRKLYPCASG